MTDLTALLGVPGVRVLASGRADGSMGFTGAPDRAAVARARTRFLSAAGLDPGAAVALRQVHGCRVLRVGPGDRGRGGLDPAAAGEGDGLATAEAGVPLVVLSADCAVAALAPGDGSAVAVLHSGWRGVVARAGAAAVRALEEVSGRPAAEFRAVLGPAIGPCCYEVGREVTTPFLANFGSRAGEWFRPGRGERPHLDLPEAVRAGLRDAGVPAAAVGPAGPCTLCGEGLFSHRRGDGGRQALVAVRAAP